MGPGRNWFGSRAGGSRGKGQEDENMGQSTIIKYINSLNIYIVWVN